VTPEPWVELRPVRWDREDGLSEHLRAYWRDLGVEPSERWHRRYLSRLREEEGKSRFTFWGYAGDQRVGLVVLRIDHDWVDPDRRVGYVAEFMIFSDFRRRGWGRGLFAAAGAWLVTRGCKDLELDVLPTNGPAMAFWKALGFQPAYHHMRWGPLQ
jgi:ribosomal protein S18 acetylase RimI-like enzyme